MIKNKHLSSTDGSPAMSYLNPDHQKKFEVNKWIP